MIASNSIIMLLKEVRLEYTVRRSKKLKYVSCIKAPTIKHRAYAQFVFCIWQGKVSEH